MAPCPVVFFNNYLHSSQNHFPLSSIIGLLFEINESYLQVRNALRIKGAFQSSRRPKASPLHTSQASCDFEVDLLPHCRYCCLSLSSYYRSLDSLISSSSSHTVLCDCYISCFSNRLPNVHSSSKNPIAFRDPDQSFSKVFSEPNRSRTAMDPEIWAMDPKTRRSLTRRLVLPVGSATISLGVILAIAIGGAVLLFGAIGTVIFLHLKKRNRHKTEVRTITEISEHGLMRSDLSNTIRSIRTPDIIFPHRISRGMSLNPWNSLDAARASSDWEDVDLSDQPPPVATAKRLSFRRGIIRVRESWPLATNIPLKMLPSQRSMVLTPVAPPGYVVQNPKRRSTKLSRKRESTESKGEHPAARSPHGSPSRDLFPAPLVLNKNMQRRSTSDTFVPSIVRSSSQRIANNRKSLTRAFTTIGGRLTGPVPMERLLTPPMKHGTESREQLINKEFAQSMVDNRVAKMSLDKGRDLVKQQRTSPISSEPSIDSLCDTNELELLPPIALRSPSKSPGGEKRHKVLISDDATIHEDRPDPLLVVAKPPGSLFGTAPQRMTGTGDPFFSSVRSSKSIISSTQLLGPRPMHFRKSTFGHEESPHRPDDYTSPLRDISGNGQSPGRTPDASDDPEHNPFRWSPQEASKTRVTPLSGRTSPTRKGHRRSNVVRLSNLPLSNRRISTVAVVQEEPEDEAPRKSIRFSLPPVMATRLYEPEKSPSPASSTTSRRRNLRPPSSATFSPDLTISEGVPHTPNSSPVSKFSSRRSFSVYSPTLSVCNYYEENGGSENEFFKPKKASPSTLRSRRQARNYSEDPNTIADFQAQQDHKTTLKSFPAIPIIPITTVLTPPPSRPLPTITSTMSGLYCSSPAPLNINGPSQLYSPRDIPSRVSTLSPPRDSLLSSISMLRRMNSQLSIVSSQPTIAEESPTLPPQPHTSLNFNVEEAQAEERGRSRGSKHYLGIGRQSQHYGRDGRTYRAEKRDSHRVYKDRRKRKGDDYDRDDKELSSVIETSPATGSNALGIIGLRFPTLTREGYNGYTPTKSSPREVIDLTGEEEDIADAIRLEISDENNKENSEGSRWSDAMTKPAKKVVRRESQIEHPSPQTPPKWSMNGMGLAGQRLLGKDKEGLPVSAAGSPDRPPSLGFYDQDGFLKSSPELRLAREVAKERIERRRRSRDPRAQRFSEEWHAVM